VTCRAGWENWKPDTTATDRRPAATTNRILEVEAAIVIIMVEWLVDEECDEERQRRVVCRRISRRQGLMRLMVRCIIVVNTRIESVE
jgi:hypothetical protein